MLNISGFFGDPWTQGPLWSSPYICVPCCVGCLGRLEKGIGSLRIGVTNCCELVCVLESNLDNLQLHARKFSKNKYKFKSHDQFNNNSSNNNPKFPNTPYKKVAKLKY